MHPIHRIALGFIACGVIFAIEPHLLNLFQVDGEPLAPLTDWARVRSVGGTCLALVGAGMLIANTMLGLVVGVVVAAGIGYAIGDRLFPGNVGLAVLVSVGFAALCFGAACGSRAGRI